MREIKPLTGLRFVAAFGVMAAHLSMRGGVDRLPFQTFPWMTLFFCLSGFVLTWTYHDQVPVGRFLWARFARIYPLFLLVFALEANVSGAAPGLWKHLLLLQAWSADQSFFSVSWSLSVEMLFYLSFPLVALALRRLSSRRLAQVGVACVALAFAGPLVSIIGGISYDTVRVFPLGRLPDFVFGCVMARFALRGVAPKLPAGLLVTATTALLFLPVPPAFHEDAIYLAPLGLLMLVLSTTESQVSRVLGARPMLALGSASYALYLIHPWIRTLQLTWFGQGFGPVLWSAGVSIVASFVLYRLVEEPARLLLRRWRLPHPDHRERRRDVVVGVHVQ